MPGLQQLVWNAHGHPVNVERCCKKADVECGRATDLDFDIALFSDSVEQFKSFLVFTLI